MQTIEDGALALSILERPTEEEERFLMGEVISPDLCLCDPQNFLLRPLPRPCTGCFFFQSDKRTYANIQPIASYSPPQLRMLNGTKHDAAKPHPLS